MKLIIPLKTNEYTHTSLATLKRAFQFQCSGERHVRSTAECLHFCLQTTYSWQHLVHQWYQCHTIRRSSSPWLQVCDSTLLQDAITPVPLSSLNFCPFCLLDCFNLRREFSPCDLVTLPTDVSGPAPSWVYFGHDWESTRDCTPVVLTRTNHKWGRWKGSHWF